MKNSTATAVKVFAWLTLVGGLILWLLDVFVDFYAALPYLGVAIAGFILLRGFAEVINLLDKISKNTEPAKAPAAPEETPRPTPENMDEEEKRHIQQFINDLTRE